MTLQGMFLTEIFLTSGCFGRGKDSKDPTQIDMCTRPALDILQIPIHVGEVIMFSTQHSHGCADRRVSRKSSITQGFNPNPVLVPSRSLYRAHDYGNADISRQRDQIDPFLCAGMSVEVQFIARVDVPRHGTPASTCIQLQLVLKASRLGVASTKKRSIAI